MMLEVQQSISQRPAITEFQELRKFTGEALREPVRWSEHPAWTIVAERYGDNAPKPPPPRTDEDIKAMIVGKLSPKGREVESLLRRMIAEGFVVREYSTERRTGLGGDGLEVRIRFDLADAGSR